MLKNFFLSFRTSSSLKRSNISRRTSGFRESLSIGILYTYSNKHNFELVNDLINRLKKEGKQVTPITHIVKMGPNDTYNFPFFNSSDVDFWGKWKSDEVNSFLNKSFDYLLSLDLNTNNMTQNILAKSKAKCRVGRFEEGKSDYFEMMIDHKENNYDQFIDQVFHYIKNVRNGN